MQLGHKMRLGEFQEINMAILSPLQTLGGILSLHGSRVHINDLLSIDFMIWTIHPLQIIQICTW